MRFKYGKFGGQFASETLIPVLDELSISFRKIKKMQSFQDELKDILENYVGRPTPIYYAKRISEKYGFKLYLKREDLLHTGAHKINNTTGQVLLAKYMGKKRVIAETGAGQHGLATATAAALFNLDCTVYMGAVDAKRQAINVEKMKLLGANVVEVEVGSKTLKEAVSEALRDYVTNFRDTHYVIGSVVGPSPFPEIVTYFQSIIGLETLSYFKKHAFMPDYIVCCVGGGSNAAGMFKPFLKEDVKLIGVEAAGTSDELGSHAATLSFGSPGIFQGAYSYTLQAKEGQIANVTSVSAGLDYPGVGPIHSYLKEKERVNYVRATDDEALMAFKELSLLEGIIPALEPSHALGYILKRKTEFRNKTILINLSGRGDKDLDIIRDRLK
ncbi:MAG: tryptophan synthase subunit beta [Deferribacterota bacterium]|nr:tryptophan synthase subunit beta [Deferribacterota bacterium]